MELMDILSWSATFFVLISFVFEHKLLRYLNLIGAVLWTLWGIGMEEGSVVFLNVAIMGVHITKLYQLSKRKG